MELFKVKNLPLTKKQIDICDFILRQENNIDVYSLSNKEFPNTDSGVFVSCTSFLHKEGLITSAHPLKFTIKGANYRNKGVVKYIRYIRLNNFFNRPILKFGVLLTGIFINLLFNIINYNHSNEKEPMPVHNNDTYHIDTVLSETNRELHKLTVSDSINKITFDSIFNIIEFHKNSLKKNN